MVLICCLSVFSGTAWSRAAKFLGGGIWRELRRIQLAQGFKILPRQDAAQVENDQKALLQLTHGSDKVGADAGAEGRCRLQGFRGNIQYSVDGIDDHAQYLGLVAGDD